MTEPATLDQIKEHITLLPGGDFRALRVWMADDEVRRREAAPQIEAARAADTQKLWESHPELKPKFETDPVEVTVTPTTKDGTITKAALLKAYPPFVQPTGAHDALPPGAIVADEGRIWRNDLPTLNVWKPGTPNAMWVDITDELLAQGRDTDAAEDETGEEQAQPEVPEDTGVQEWAPNLNVKPGERYIFQGDTYEVVQAHESAAHWPPNAVPALYRKV